MENCGDTQERGDKADKFLTGLGYSATAHYIFGGGGAYSPGSGGAVLYGVGGGVRVSPGRRCPNVVVVAGMVRMSPRTIFLNVISLTVIAVCFYVVVGHMNYLSKSSRPSRETISKELDELVVVFPGTRVSEVEIFDKKSVYISARVHMKASGDVLATRDGQKRMEAHGWRKAQVVHGGIDRYCKGGLVAEVTPLSPAGSYALQVNWGNADAVCEFK